MTDDQLLEGVCECGEKGPIGDICDICGGVFSEGNSEFDDFDDDEDLDSYPSDLIKKTKNSEPDIISLEEADKEIEEDEEF
ncbi:MAG: hypothetical protein WCP93_03400 [Candidatus Berkelbacteria bacterium]